MGDTLPSSMLRTREDLVGVKEGSVYPSKSHGSRLELVRERPFSVEYGENCVQSLVSLCSFLCKTEITDGHFIF